MTHDGRRVFEAADDRVVMVDDLLDAQVLDRRRIAAQLLFLAGERAGNVTGSDFMIDGGLVKTLRANRAPSHRGHRAAGSGG